MKIKNEGKRGTRTICKCLNCGEEFSELNIKIKEGGGKFCCNNCYKEYRKKNAKDPKIQNKLNQKKHKYGLSAEDYKNMHEEQNYKCAICGEDITEKSCVDHDHNTGKIRGLLCNRCNLVLGLIKDNISILQNSIIYLNKQQ